MSMTLASVPRFVEQAVGCIRYRKNRADVSQTMTEFMMEAQRNLLKDSNILVCSGVQPASVDSIADQSRILSIISMKDFKPLEVKPIRSGFAQWVQLESNGVAQANIGLSESFRIDALEMISKDEREQLESFVAPKTTTKRSKSL